MFMTLNIARGKKEKLLVHDGEFQFEYEGENLVDYGKFNCFSGFTDEERQEISYALKFQANTEALQKKNF